MPTSHKFGVNTSTSFSVNNQKGVAHLLVLVAIIGVVAFILISSSTDFKNKLFANLFPKQFSRAASGPIAPPQFLGYTNIAPTADTGMSNNITATRFVMGSTGGTVSSMSVYVNAVGSAPNNQYQLAIYADSNSQPGALVAKSSSATLTANSWNSLPISANLSADTAYWLAYNSNGSDLVNNLRRDSGNQFCSMPQTYGSWPTSFNPTECHNAQWNIYATYTPSATLPPTPAPTPPPGPTATLGYTSIAPNADTGMSNNVTATRFVMGTSGGVVSSMSVYVNAVDVSPNNQFQVAIYSDNNSRPGTLLSQSSLGTLAANSWNTASISATLSANTAYWLAYNSNSSNSLFNNLRRDRGNLFCGVAQTFGSWPTTFSPTECHSNQWNIYATYTPIPSKRVFVTSTSYNGNLGGLAGADSQCQTRADAASLGGSWRAWLSIADVAGLQADYRLNHNNGPYQLINGTTIANNWDDLIDGTLMSPINITELNSPVTGAGSLVWTNTNMLGRTNSPSGHCNYWSSTIDTINGTTLFGGTGSSSQSSSSWTFSGSLRCTFQAALYCFEQ